MRHNCSKWFGSSLAWLGLRSPQPNPAHGLVTHLLLRRTQYYLQVFIQDAYLDYVHDGLFAA
jgi:hypothetical protein